MRTALVHEWLTEWGGSESALAEIAACFDHPDLYAVIDFLRPEHRRRLPVARLATTFIQGLPWSRSRFWNYLPLMPLAIEQFDLRGYDLVVSSSHAVAKGVLTSADQLHICYIYSPMRYIWDLYHDYLQDYRLTSGIRAWLVRQLFHKLRLWDLRTANNVDYFVAISDYVARRVWKTYRREATTIYPPVDLDRFSLHQAKDDYYLTVSRLVSYKKVGMIVEAFRDLPDRKLIVIGDGPEMAAIRKVAGRNVTMLGAQSDEVVRDHMQRAKAFLFAAVEDFGIAPVEAQACGTPVIAYRQGGACETVRGLDLCERPTGLFFSEQTPRALSQAIAVFELYGQSISAADCRANAERFSRQRFREEFSRYIDTCRHEWKTSRGT